MSKRTFDCELRFRVTSEMAQLVKAAAQKKGRSVPDYLRQVLRENIATNELADQKSALQSYVADAVEEKLKPVENRLAKITAKTAHASAISIFLQAQAMADLGKSDVVDIFKIAREKGLAFVRDRGIPNTKDIAEGIEDIERRT
ncbi:MAG: hypothetical protein GX150_01320 [Firmicutes bacterium]|nr:hypothetical protein [Bacillota bacterium]NMA23946.1 hypothetical protein [Spirochaetales bacterium]